MVNQSVKIKFVGKKNTVFNIVSLNQFEKVYKPKGWVLVDVNQKQENNRQVDSSMKTEEIVEKLEIKDEQSVKNIETMKKNSKKQNFDDKIIKE